MNDKEHHLPPPTEQTVDIGFLFQVRIGLSNITEPSPEIVEACTTLDKIIVNFTRSLKGSNNG